MKTVYRFKPHNHWNYIPENVYNVLAQFYGINMLQVDYEEE